MLQCIMQKKYTGETAEHRKDRQTARQRHTPAIRDNEAAEELPEALLPDIFSGSRGIYRESLKSVPDPGNPDKCVYPLHLILHRIIPGFINGNRHIGVLFPGKRMSIGAGKKKSGALLTRKAVHTLPRRISRAEAYEVPAPLRDRPGYAPDLIVRRGFRNPDKIVSGFREERKQAESEKRKRLREEYEAKERSEGMSAAEAERSVSASLKTENSSESLQGRITGALPTP